MNNTTLTPQDLRRVRRKCYAIDPELKRILEAAEAKSLTKRTPLSAALEKLWLEFLIYGGPKPRAEAQP